MNDNGNLDGVCNGLVIVEQQCIARVIKRCSKHGSSTGVLRLLCLFDCACDAMGAHANPNGYATFCVLNKGVCD